MANYYLKEQNLYGLNGIAYDVFFLGITNSRINQRVKFQIGFDYVYMVNLFFFICFFSSLQSIIAIFAIIGMSLMYWTQKMNIFT